MILAAFVAVVFIAVYVWQDGINRCQDGDRYTSGKPQPTPFNRRFLHWPPRLLMVVTWASFVALGSMLGGWKPALLFISLPGVWFCATHPTTVDAPAMFLAWCSAAAIHSSLDASVSVPLAVAAAAIGGGLHERSPVFAALYAWHPLPLVGLVVPLLVGWLRKPAAPNHASPELADRLVGHGTWGALAAHKPYVDMLSETGLVWSLRGLPLTAAWAGVPPSAWASLAVAYASRLIGTDTARFLMWAAPPLCARLGEVPMWMVGLHMMTFRRVNQ